MKAVRAIALLCSLFILTGCGIARFVNPPQKWHSDPNFKNDPNFGARPVNYTPILKNAKQVAAEIPTVYIELHTNDGSWFGIGGDSLISASGVVVEYAGRPYILSAGHITMSWTTDVREVYAYFPNSQTPPEEVEIIAYDSLLDFSLLRFKNENFRPNKPYPIIGHSSDLQPGEKLVALGSPLGFKFSVDEGTVMNVAIGRYNFPMPHPQLILLDITGNPGSSGGPVLNDRGELIGIFTGALLGAPSPMPYAVPIDDIARVLRNLKRPGKIEHPQSRFRVNNTWEWSPKDFKSKEVRQPIHKGVFVSTDEAPKENKDRWSGLLRGDVILQANGISINNAIQFWKYIILDCQSGQMVEFKVDRYGTEMAIEVKLN